MFLSNHIIVDCSVDQCREVKDDCSMQQQDKVCKKWDNPIQKSLILEDIETKVQSKETDLNVYILFAFFKTIWFFLLSYTRKSTAFGYIFTLAPDLTQKVVSCTRSPEQPFSLRFNFLKKSLQRLNVRVLYHIII